MAKVKTFDYTLSQLDSFAQEIINLFPEGAILGLSGELGSGKTTLVRAIIQLFAKKQKIKIDRVVSPSFVLHQSYEQLKPMVHHFDLYRMNQVDEAMLVELEYYEILEKTKAAKGFVFIEWPEMCQNTKILKLDAQLSITILESSRRVSVSHQA